MAASRRNSRLIRVGAVAVGGDSPVSIQSMTNTDTRDAAATLDQIRALHRLGCQIIRLAVPDPAAAAAIRAIRAESPIPVVADIHFDYRLALAAMENGADAIRLNPGNLNDEGGLEQVAALAVERGIPIRVGANSGSVRTALVRRYQRAAAGAATRPSPKRSSTAPSSSAGCSKASASHRSRRH